MPTIGSFLIDTDDLGEAEAALCANFGRIDVGAVPDGSPTRTRVWRNRIGDLALDEFEFTYAMNFTMEATPSVMLCRVRSGTMAEHLPGGDVVMYGPGDVAAFGAVAGAEFTGAVNSAQYDLFVIDRRALNGVAGQPDRAARLTSSRPLSHSANQFVADAVDYVRHGVMANAHAGNEPLLASALTNYLAAAVVSSFPVELPEAAASARLHGGIDVLVRRAVTFIDENAHTEITPADIAAAANVSPPVLQMMFVRHQGCTPMQYVRRVRLDHAHRELVSADPVTTSVTDIARRWGFGSASRFAVSYRLAYGRSPSVTLRGDSRVTRH